MTSQEGKGTEFVITLDFKLLDTVMVYGPIPELVGARALVVDDDIHTCTSVSKMLRDIEMRADWSTSGKEAIIRAKEAFEQKDAFEVYIIDWLMPDMNGIETVRRIRGVIGDSASIIILSAYDWADIEQEAREAGVRLLWKNRFSCQNSEKFLPNLLRSYKRMKSGRKKKIDMPAKRSCWLKTMH